MNVLSMFDGISCGQYALNSLGVKVENYFASEIDKYAMQVTQKNFPRTINLHDVKGIDYSQLPKIDLLIAGSPCQGFSFAGKQLNFNDPRSALFFEFVKALSLLKPKYFLLENVKMKKEYQDIISKLIGLEPQNINTNLIMPINRDRLYWSNLTFSPSAVSPRHDEISEKLLKQGEVFATTRGKSSERFIRSTKFLGCLTATMYKGARASGRPLVAKKHCLGGNFDSFVKDIDWRSLTVNDCEMLQGLPLDYTEGISKTQRLKCLGNAWTIDVIKNFFSRL